MRVLDPASPDMFGRPYGRARVYPPSVLVFDAARKKRPRSLPRVIPSAGIEAKYRRRLLELIDEMCRETQELVLSKYERNPPELSMDAMPSNVLRDAVDRMVDKWTRRFDRASEEMADYFSEAVEERSSRRMRKILRDGGFSVKFKMTDAMRDALNATIEENVGLIRSIPQKYLADVQGKVMRSVAAGRDLGTLAKDLQKSYGVTKKRAALIARDQNNKATATVVRARQIEVGITQAVWHHSHAGKEPRPTHVKMEGKKYDVAEGMWDPAVGEHIFPGQLINCRCTSSSVIPGFE